MNLADILTGASNILPDMQAADRWAAIDDLVGNLIATGKIKEENRDAILAVVKKRESSMSTGIGFRHRHPSRLHRPHPRSRRRPRPFQQGHQFRRPG